MDRRLYKGQHGGEENGEDNPVQHNPQFSGVLGQRDAQEAYNPTMCEVLNDEDTKPSG
jgi:hypothetical protein